MSTKKNEAADVPFSGPYTKGPDVVTDKSGAKHSPMSRVRHLARMAAQKQEKEKEKPVKEEVQEIDEAGLKDACWKGYTAVGTKTKNGKKVPNCVPVKEDIEEGLKPEHNMRPGWMLKADPELAAKVKKNKEIAKARKASYGNPAAGKSVKEETIFEGAYEKAEENKKSADAAKKQGDMFAHHLHMADHHDNLSQWHSEKGRHGEADRHAAKSEEHHEKAMKLKEGYVPDRSGVLNNKDKATMGKLAALMAKEKAAKAAKAAKKPVKEESELDEAKKANTASTRAELNKRPRKELTGADADKKKKESDDAWERLMAHAAANKKTNEEANVQEETKKPDPANKSDSPGFQAYLAKRRAEKEKAKQATTTVKEGLGRGREDDEYHVPDPVDNRKKHTVKMKLSKDGGPVQHKQMDVHTIHGAEHAKKFAHSKAKEQGWTVHEEVEQIDEISDKALNNYLTAAKKDRERNKINKAAPDTAQRASAHARDKKRIAGMNKAKSYVTPGTVGHAKNQARRAANEEVEQIEERNKENALKRKTMDASRGARYKAGGNPVPDRDEKHGTAQAHNKAIGRALRNEEEETSMEFTQEELQLIEQFIQIAEKMNMSKASMGDVIKDFKKSSAPQFKGKSELKRRQMAIAAKLEADREAKKEETEVEVAGFKSFMLEYETDKSGRYVHKGKYGSSYDAGSDDDDDDKPASTEKRGRGRPKGSSSGARQKGSTTGKKRSGVEMTGYPLHLPNR